MLLPVLTLIYLCSSLDKSNLGNAKTLGLVPDIGVDTDGSKYAFLNSLYYVSYAPFSECCRGHSEWQSSSFYNSGAIGPFG